MPILHIYSSVGYCIVYLIRVSHNLQIDKRNNSTLSFYKLIICFGVGQEGKVMDKAYIIKRLDAANGMITILDSTQHSIIAKVCETKESTTVTSKQGIATVLGFISKPKLISEISYGDGKPYVWGSEKKKLLLQCEDVLENKNFEDYSVEDWIILSEWKR